jgi:ABC-2 type transport system ATP-binding protein
VCSVDVRGLTRRFGSFVAVDSLSFAVSEGEVFGLLGPNGAGKTTTLRMLACLISPSEGEATVAGFDVRYDPVSVRRSVGILTENPSLYERMTAFENLDFFAEAYGLSDAQVRRSRIQELLEFLSLWDRRNDKTATFSKGMKQKLAIARATVHNPPILFMDEPTAGLDPESAKEIRDLMGQLSRQEKRTILLCTHHLEDAERLCERVMIMNKGKTVVIGSPDQLREKMGGCPEVNVVLWEITKKIVDAVEGLKETRGMVVNLDGNSLTVQVDDVRFSTPNLVDKIVSVGGKVLSVNVVRPSLEEAYLKLVREDLR